MQGSDKTKPPDSGQDRPVLVLAQRPQDYAADLRLPGLAPQFVSSVPQLLESLAEQPVSGFVLEVETVLQAPALERGHLFQLAEAFPLLRARRSGQNGAPAYLDDVQDFAVEVRGFSPRPARHVPRVPVLLRALLQRREADGHADDAAGIPATILDISACGGALACEAAFEPGEELSMRILDFSDPEPIDTLICWSGRRGGPGAPRCSGVRFLHMGPGQACELGARYLGLKLDA